MYLTEKGCFFAFAQDLFNPLTFYSCMNTCITFCLYIHICVCVCERDCVCERERDCVCERERKRLCVRERDCERDCA